MSDRAKTNIAFTDLLVDYRKEIMPQILKSWDDLDFEQQDSCCRVDNFFRGLHMLVNFAESLSSVLKSFESMCEKIDSSESFKDFYSLDFEDNVDVNISKLDGHVITFLRFVPTVLVKVSIKEMVVMQIFVLIAETKRRGTPSFLLEIIDLMLFSLWQNLHYFIRAMY